MNRNTRRARAIAIAEAKPAALALHLIPSAGLEQTFRHGDHLTATTRPIILQLFHCLGLTRQPLIRKLISNLTQLPANIWASPSCLDMNWQ
jgi:hypothetical protein